jgi:lipopolysaccharide exporter
MTAANTALDPGAQPVAERQTSTELVGRRVGTSAMWSALNAGVLRGSTFVVSLIIVHLVAPYYFGVYTVAITVFNILVSVYELGLSSAIVRFPHRTREIAPTIVTLSIINCTVLAGLMVLFAEPIARVLGAANAASAIRVLAIVLFLAGFTSVPVAIIARDFKQNRMFVVDAANFLSATVVMLALVLTGHPVMGLALSRVAAQIVTLVLLLCLTPERYLPGFSWAEAKPLLAYGLPLAGSLLVTIAIANVDFVVVAHTLGARQLGFYNLAFSIASWPITIFGAVLISVTLPTLSRVRECPPELTKHLRAGLSAVAALALPVCALLAALAVPLIDTVYGLRWHTAWKALVVLAIFGAARTLLLIFSDLAVALGLTRRLLIIQLAWLTTLIPAMILCVHRWGIFGAGIAHAVVIVGVVVPLYLVTVRMSTPVQLGWIKPSLGRPAIASLAVAATAYASTKIVGAESSKLLIGAAVGLVTYLLVAGTWLKPLLKTLRAMYWSRDIAATAPGTGEHSALVKPETEPTAVVRATPDGDLLPSSAAPGSESARRIPRSQPLRNVWLIILATTRHGATRHEHGPKNDESISVAAQDGFSTQPSQPAVLMIASDESRTQRAHL